MVGQYEIVVDEYVGRLAIEGVDANYSAGRVRQASLLSLPFSLSLSKSASARDMHPH